MDLSDNDLDSLINSIEEKKILEKNLKDLRYEKRKSFKCLKNEFNASKRDLMDEKSRIIYSKYDYFIPNTIFLNRGNLNANTPLIDLRVSIFLIA